MLETPQRPAPHRNGKSRLSPRQLLSTRQGTMVAGLITAFVAAGVLMVFLGQYRESVGDSSRPVEVLVAKSFLEKGTSGDAIARTGLTETEAIPKGEVKDGALTDAGALRGKVASKSLYPGQQLTAGGFTATGDGVRTKLIGKERAVSVSLDGAHGLIGNIEPGDRVDVLAGFNVISQGAGQNRPILRTLVQDVLVLDAPKDKPSSGTGGVNNKQEQVTVRVSDEQAAAIAFAADNGKVWVTLRPPTGARSSRVSTVTLESLLVGLKPIRLKPEGPGR